jgi:hypothetical protein
LDEETDLPILVKPSPILDFRLTPLILTGSKSNQHVDVAGIISSVEKPFYSNNFSKHFRKVYINCLNDNFKIAVMFWGQSEDDEIHELNVWRPGQLLLVKNALVRDEFAVRGSLPATKRYKRFNKKFISSLKRLYA